MRRILLIGNCPLPEENSKSRPAAGLRTYQFFKSLAGTRAGGGFEIKMVTIAMPECYENVDSLPADEDGKNFSRISLSKNDPHLISRIQKLHDEFLPEAIVAVNTYPSYIASLLKSRVPMWADLNGWIMAEAQAQAFKRGGDEYLPHYLGLEKSVLERADKISTVSSAQSFAILGELAFLRRLNSASFNYNFVHHVPNATEWFKGECGDGESCSDDCCEKSSEKQTDDFLLLWLGGYNTWVDENTLFKGVENAMKKCEDIHFISTGGNISGLDNKTFARFKKMIENSPYKDRFVFLGWVETSKIPSLYGKADVGLNVDRMCVETLTGARNRINEMMKFGLPVITTAGSEISAEVGFADAGLVVPSGDHEALTESILKMHKERGTVRFDKYGEGGRKYTEENDYKTTLAPLFEWLQNPRPAPDRGAQVRSKTGMAKSAVKGRLNYLRENGVKKSFLKLWQRLRSGSK